MVYKWLRLAKCDKYLTLWVEKPPNLPPLQELTDNNAGGYTTHVQKCLYINTSYESEIINFIN